MIATILAVWRALPHWKTFVRVACVVAIALGSVSHVVADLSSANAAPITVAVVQSDDNGAGDCAIVVEQCHACCVVPFLAVAAASREKTAPGAVPDGDLPHLFSFRQPITAPPPRLLT